MSKIKNILIPIGIGLGALALFGYKKGSDVSKILDNMEFEIANISNFGLALPNITFMANIKVINNSDVNFGANLSSRISIRQIRVYNQQGVYIGQADTNLYQIEIAAFSTTLLPKMRFVIDPIKALGEVSSNLQTYIQGDYSRLNYEIDVNILGKTVTLEA